MKGRARRWALILLCAVVLGGCASTPPDTLIRKEPDAGALVSADTGSLTPDTLRAALYFRYGDTAYLAPEEREIPVQRDETPEKALVRALVEGPAATAASLNPVFPAGTQVLAVTSQGDTLFVTFNEALLGRYADEPGDISNEPWKTESPLRRTLCMDALTATLTDAGVCARVQVLVYRDSVQSASMRLPAGFFTRTADETLLPPLTRNEDTLLTPYNAASILLSAWMAQDWPLLYGLAARDAAGDARPGENDAFAAFDAARTLTGFRLSNGNVSLDGKTAVLCAEISLRGAGADLHLSGYPLRLIREDGLWKIAYSRLMAMMNQD